jgi:hypothetical protein
MTRRTSRGSSTARPAGWRRWRYALRRRETCARCGKNSRLPYCDVCGYELVRRTRADVPKVPNV